MLLAYLLLLVNSLYSYSPSPSSPYHHSSLYFSLLNFFHLFFFFFSSLLLKRISHFHSYLYLAKTPCFLTYFHPFLFHPSIPTFYFLFPNSFLNTLLCLLSFLTLFYLFLILYSFLLFFLSITQFKLPIFPFFSSISQFSCLPLLHSLYFIFHALPMCYSFMFFPVSPFFPFHSVQTILYKQESQLCSPNSNQSGNLPL